MAASSTHLVRLLVALGLAGSLCTGCFAPSATRMFRGGGHSDLPARVSLETVPFYSQETNQCGPAALAMAMGYYGASLTPSDLEPQVFIPGREGSLQVEIQAAARRHGFLAFPLPPSMEALFRELAAGHPVLVLQNLSLGILPRWHYAVVVGYDAHKRRVLLRSGRHSLLETRFSVFERTWRRGARWGLVLLPVGKVPVTADVGSYLPAAHDFELVGLHDFAETAYRAGSLRWPGESVFLFALGNLHFESGRLDEAENAFREASILSPGESYAWHNLAQVLRELGRFDEGREAIAQARELDPQDPLIQKAFHEFHGT